MMKIPEKEIGTRIQGLKNYLNQNVIDLVIIMQNVDQYYYTGTIQDGILLIPVSGYPILFIKRTLQRAILESPFGKGDNLGIIIDYRGFNDLYDYIMDNGIKAEKIGLEMDVIPAHLYLKLLSLFKASEFVDISTTIRKMRGLKSPFEIGLFEEGGRRLDKVFARIKEIIKPGITEYEVHSKLVQFFMEEGSSLPVRTRRFNLEASSDCVLSGKNGSNHSAMDSPSGGGEGITHAYPSGAGFKRLEKGEPVLIDVVFNYEGYNVDCTRVFALGRLPRKMETAHEVSKNLHEFFIEEGIKGTYIPEFFRKVHGIVDRERLTQPFMGGVKFIGHGVGLELDELPVISESYEDHLKEGMVIAFEPKFVFEQGSLGYENTYGIENGKVKSFNSAVESIQYL